MARIDLDTSHWPLVFAKLPPVASDSEVEEFLRQLQVIRERREPYALILDASESKGFSPTQRRMQADYIASGLALSRVYLRAFAFVADSALQRGMLTAIFWMRKPESPYRIFPSGQRAEAWARELLAAAPKGP